MRTKIASVDLYMIMTTTPTVIATTIALEPESYRQVLYRHYLRRIIVMESALIVLCKISSTLANPQRLSSDLMSNDHTSAAQRQFIARINSARDDGVVGVDG